MSANGAYVFIVSMDVDPAHEDLFNEVYDTEHIPFLLEVDGVVGCRRMKSEPFKVSIGGEIKDQGAASPRYTAIYEIDSPEVLTSDAWVEAVERGRWPGVRPHTSNRSHAFYKAN
ncbi:MAG: hypothetical protein AAF439_04025 [Pseudomonadota bacterium]